MGDVLVAGVTHYPPLLGVDENMSWVLEWTLEDPDIPEPLRTPDGWPSQMRAEYGQDRGTFAAGRHRASLLEGFRRVRRALDSFRPDVVVLWGDDQYENFKEDVIPPFTILAYHDLVVTPWKSNSRPNVWGEGPDTTFEVPIARELGKYLAAEILDRDVDIAYSYKPLHHPTLPHAFLNTILLLDYDRVGLSWPIVPVSVNCYGSRVISYRGGLSRLADSRLPKDPPGPSPRRCMALGAAMADAVRMSPWRVALVASSSWSHAFLVDQTYRLYPDIPADRKVYDALVGGAYETLRAYTTAEVEEAGQQELLNWFCLAGAAEALGVLPEWSALVETYAFNSTKVFMTYPVVRGHEPAE
jgi:Catalytic LigB subunit of aromatic ring-opening dioxygenase